MTNYLSIKETAKRLGVHRDTVTKLVASGQLKSIRVGRLIRIDEASIATLGKGN